MALIEAGAGAVTVVGDCEGEIYEDFALHPPELDVLFRALVHERDGAAGRPMTDVAAAEQQPVITAISASLEGKTARQRNPHAPGTLAYVAWVCAGLGGWTGYYCKPGARGHA